MRFFILYIVIAASFISCKKDDDAKKSRLWGTASALRNGESWTGVISASENTYPSDTGIIIIMNAVNVAGFFKDYLAFTKIPVNTDKHLLSLTSLIAIDSLVGVEYATLLSDGHVFGDIYNILTDDSVEDYIEITEISDDEIKGNFQVSFLRDTTSAPVSASTPDTLIFTGGQFHTRIRN